MINHAQHRNEQWATGATIATNDTASARQNGGYLQQVCKGRKSRQKMNGQQPLPLPDAGHWHSARWDPPCETTFTAWNQSHLGAIQSPLFQLTLFLHSAQCSKQTAIQLQTTTTVAQKHSCMPNTRSSELHASLDFCSLEIVLCYKLISCFCLRMQKQCMQLPKVSKMF